MLILLVLASVHGEIEALAMKSAGRAEQSRQWFGVDAADPEAPFATKAAALVWLDRIDDYDPVTPEWRRANELLLASGPSDVDAEWFFTHGPETGTVMSPLRIFKRLVLSAQRGDVSWQKLRGAITRYVSRTTAGPMHFVGLAVDVVLLELIANTPELGANVGAMSLVAQLHERTDVLRHDLRLNRASPLAELQRCEALRVEILATLRELERGS